MDVRRTILSTSLVLLLVGSSAIAGCQKAAGPPAAPPPESSPAPEAAPPVPPPLKWGPCPAPTDPDADADVVAALQCGELSVPIDYAKPDGAKASIAVSRLPATGAKIGSLVINPGGPGGSGVDFVPNLVADVPKAVLARFDLVGFDPRGVGRSTPAVDCNSDAEDDEARADLDLDYTPAGVAQTEQEVKDYVQRCVDKSGEELLAHVGTKAVARDMDQLRAALGDEKLTYYGASYGTRLGSQYAELFPNRVRALVLDGAVDTAVSPMQSWVDQSAAFQKVFDVYAANCAKKGDCPLGTDPRAAVVRLHALLDPLVAKPARTSDPRGLSYPDAMLGVFDALYVPWTWDDLTAGLAELRDGKPADGLLALADEYMVRNADGHYDNSSDSFNAVSCADAAYPTDAAAWDELDRKLREVQPFGVYGQFTGNAPRGACAFWPVAADGVPHPVSAPGLPRVLVVSTTGDPATPYVDGVHLAEQLNAELITYEGNQHTAALYGMPCVDDVVSAYLIDLKLPAANVTCTS